jgi:hypothetical protein
VTSGSEFAWRMINVDIVGGAARSNAGPAIDIAASCVDFALEGVRVSGNNETGIRCQTGSQVSLAGIYANGNNVSSGSFYDVDVQSSTVANVTFTGHNMIGTTNGALGSNTVALANVGTSPATITAGAAPETHYIAQSATNTATVAKGGQTLHTLSVANQRYIVQLGPLESYTVTWATTQPTYIKDVH